VTFSSCRQPGLGGLADCLLALHGGVLAMADLLLTKNWSETGRRYVQIISRKIKT